MAYVLAMDGARFERNENMMPEGQIKEVVLRLIKQTAPEADVGSLKLEERLRDQLDFDSVDFLNFALALQEAFKVEIPEIEFIKLATLSGCIRYLMSRNVAAPSPFP